MFERQPDGRSTLDLRPCVFETGVNRYAEGSCLIRMGHTHVLCTVSVENSVPNWMVGKNRGWLTAEYALLPRATHTRSRRDREKISGRTQEIQRLIGRSLRSMINLGAIGERTIMIDCDVLQADGGTRTASINGASIALVIALQGIAKKMGETSLEKLWRNQELIAGISLGLHGEEVLVDLDYQEDSRCDVDMNFVMTSGGNLIEVQGTAEQRPFSREALNAMADAALQACATINAMQRDALKKHLLLKIK